MQFKEFSYANADEIPSFFLNTSHTLYVFDSSEHIPINQILWKPFEIEDNYWRT